MLDSFRSALYGLPCWHRVLQCAPFAAALCSHRTCSELSPIPTQRFPLACYMARVMQSIAVEVRQQKLFSLFGGWRNGQTNWRRLGFLFACSLYRNKIRLTQIDCHFSDCTLATRVPLYEAHAFLIFFEKAPISRNKSACRAFEAVIIRSESSLVSGHFRNGRLASTSFFSLSLSLCLSFALAGHAVGAHAVGLPSRGRDRHRGRSAKLIT